MRDFIGLRHDTFVDSRRDELDGERRKHVVHKSSTITLSTKMSDNYSQALIFPASLKIYLFMINTNKYQ